MRTHHHDNAPDDPLTFNWQTHLYGDGWELHGQCVAPRKKLGAELTVGTGDSRRGVGITLGAGYFLSATLEAPWTARLVDWLVGDDVFDRPRDIGVRVFGGKIWLDCWSKTHASSHDDPWWYRQTIDLKDILLGESTYHKEPLEEATVAVELPEATYTAQATTTRQTWSRPRWPDKTKVYTEITIPEGAPVPGKGTTGYNCGPDALISSSFETKDPQQAADKFAGQVLRLRRRRGGPIDYAKRPSVSGDNTHEQTDIVSPPDGG